MEKTEKTKADKIRLMMLMFSHVGKNNMISMADLYSKMFGDDKHNTRMIRKLVRELRDEGVPICSSFSGNFGGYWIAVGSDLETFCLRFRESALKKLRLEAKLRKTTLSELLGQIQLELEDIP